ncbi:MAG: cupin domain-containing protein [Deinococcales bacterium]
MQQNIFSNIPKNIPEEIFETILESEGVRLERIISQGHHSPEGFWYNQDQAEWVIVLKGKAQLEFEDGIIELGAGDYLNIAAHQKHRVKWTTPDEETIWLAVFF